MHGPTELHKIVPFYRFILIRNFFALVTCKVGRWKLWKTKIHLNPTTVKTINYNQTNLKKALPGEENDDDIHICF